MSWANVGRQAIPARSAAAAPPMTSRRRGVQIMIDAPVWPSVTASDRNYGGIERGNSTLQKALSNLGDGIGVGVEALVRGKRVGVSRKFGIAVGGDVSDRGALHEVENGDGRGRACP